MPSWKINKDTAKEVKQFLHINPKLSSEGNKAIQLWEETISRKLASIRSLSVLTLALNLKLQVEENIGHLFLHQQQ